LFLDITFGAAPWKLPDSNEAVASNLQRPLRLRFVTPDNSTEKDTGTLVGLAEVSDGTPQTDSNRGQGHVLLNVYRMKDVKIFSSAGIEYANLVYVLTSGQKPDLTPPVKKPDDKSS
jgi:hypothetical protein